MRPLAFTGVVWYCGGTHPSPGEHLFGSVHESTAPGATLAVRSLDDLPREQRGFGGHEVLLVAGGNVTRQIKRRTYPKDRSKKTAKAPKTTNTLEDKLVCGSCLPYTQRIW